MKQERAKNIICLSWCKEASHTICWRYSLRREWLACRQPPTEGSRYSSMKSVLSQLLQEKDCQGDITTVWIRGIVPFWEREHWSSMKLIFPAPPHLIIFVSIGGGSAGEKSCRVQMHHQALCSRAVLQCLYSVRIIGLCVIQAWVLMALLFLAQGSWACSALMLGFVICF